MSPETRAFLDAVRTAEDPTPDDERRVLAAVRVAVVAGAVAGAGLGVSQATKALGGGLATGVKVGGWVAGLSAAAWIASAALSPDRPALPLAAVLSNQPGSHLSESGERPRRAGAPEAPVVLPRDEQPSGAGGVASPARPASSAASAPSASSAVSAPGASSAVSAASAPSASSAASAPSAPSAPGATSAASSLRAELSLLAEVQAALARGDGATALRRLDEHVSADRRLLAERRAARILALCSLGRTAEAEQSVRTFFREHSTSVQRSAVERSCAGKSHEPR